MLLMDKKVLVVPLHMLYIYDIIHVGTCMHWHKTMYCFHAWRRSSANINSPTDASRREEKEEKRREGKGREEREQKNEEKKEVKNYMLTVVLIVGEVCPCVVNVRASFVSHVLIARKAVCIHNWVLVQEFRSESIVLPAVCVSYNPCVDFLCMCAVGFRN